MNQKKKALRQLVRKIKIINRTIENDNLWRGRFCVRLKRVEYRYYSDNSGIYLIYWYNMIDKKTGFKMLYQDIFLPGYYGNMFDMTMEMNDFIVKFCNVWENPEEIKNDKTDYRKVRV